MLIARIRLNQVLPNLDTRQVFVCRVNTTGMEPDDLDALANSIATRWMADNPGVPTQFVIDWPRHDELGNEYAWRRAINQAPNKLVMPNLGDDGN